MRNRVAAAVLLFLPAGAFAQQAPCTSPLSTKVTPCAPAQEQASDVVATLDGAPIRVGDLDAETRKTLAGLDAAIAAAHKKATREALDDLLVDREAARRGTTSGKLLFAEVMMKTARPTEAEVSQEIAEHPNKYKTPAEDRDWAAGTLFDRRLSAREREFIGTLEKRFTVALRSTSHVDLAAADVRRDAMEDEKTAVDRVVHDRLLAAEPGRPAIPPAQPTDAELRAEWEKWKKLYGDDFEKARADVVESLMQQRKAASEKAFDEQLREGHTVRLLFEVPTRPALDVVGRLSPAQGPKDAKVTLVEWGDFECPPCGAMSAVVDEVLAPYGARVRYVFRQSPLSMHPHAWKAAEAAMAAHAQGKFFPYAHILFANQKALDVASLKKYASDTGLDRKRFDADLDSGRFAGDVLIDRRRGLRAGVQGTPTFFINGVRGGNDIYSLEGMRAAIDAALAKASGSTR